MSCAELIHAFICNRYVPILAGKQRYPVIRDANGVVLSLPPIINSDHSKISTETKNIFIESVYCLPFLILILFSARVGLRCSHVPRGRHIFLGRGTCHVALPPSTDKLLCFSMNSRFKSCMIYMRRCTATDLTKAKTVLQMITCMFSEYCAKPFTIEPVDVVTPDGVTTSYPDLSSRTEVVEASKLNRRIGIDCWAPKLAELLNRMQLPTDVAENGRDLVVSVSFCQLLFL